MPGDVAFRTVVIGGSAGSLEPLTTIVGLLPPSLNACVLIVIHTGSESVGVLPRVLARRSALPVTFAGDLDPITPRRIYVARPDCHLIVTADGLRVVHGPREHGFRPAVDPLFRTAGREMGPRAIGVILSGALGDGAYGLSVIKRHGGRAIVQDPAEATVDRMPNSAIATVDVDYVLPSAEIAPTIARLAGEPVQQGDTTMARANDLEPQLPSAETSVSEMERRYGAPSALTCPDCGGALWEIEEGRVVRYQCHVGHQYAPDALDSGQRDTVDGALWSAVRVLEEHASLRRKMAKRAAGRGLKGVADVFEERARDAHDQARQIRAVLFAASDMTAPAPAVPAARRREIRHPKRKRGR